MKESKSKWIEDKTTVTLDRGLVQEMKNCMDWGQSYNDFLEENLEFED
jgi:hypothetical protein